MRQFAVALALSLLTAAPIRAGCPEAPDHSAEFKELVAAVQKAPNEAAARIFTNRMWELWADAPDEIAQAMLDRGMARRGGYDFLGALNDLDKLVDYCPDYAEGYNQRAFVNFIQRDYPRTLVDLDRALALSPSHIAARSGRALTLLGLGRINEARTDLQAALTLNPWLSERHLLAPGGPLAPEGEDI